MRNTHINPQKLLVILVAALCITLFGCKAGDDSMEVTPPKRPANVPEEAIWSGGADGGAFIHITKSKDTPDNVYTAEIYFDTTGETWYRGRLLLESSENHSFDFKNENVYSGWDGDTLYLRDGRALKAIDPVK
jgi:hypothetical protein